MTDTGYVDDDGFITKEEFDRRMAMRAGGVIPGAFTPTDEMTIPVLVDRTLFEDMVGAIEERDGKTLEVKYGGTMRGTLTYCEATVYEVEPHPDPMTVGSE